MDTDALIMVPLVVFFATALITGALTTTGTFNFNVLGIISIPITLNPQTLLLILLGAVFVVIVGGGIIYGLLTLGGGGIMTFVGFKVVGYGVLWFFLAGLSYSTISGIPLFGVPIWWIFTFMYAAGVFLNIEGGRSK